MPCCLNVGATQPVGAPCSAVHVMPQPSTECHLQHCHTQHHGTVCTSCAWVPHGVAYSPHSQHPYSMTLTGSDNMNREICKKLTKPCSAVSSNCCCGNMVLPCKETPDNPAGSAHKPYIGLQQIVGKRGFYLLIAAPAGQQLHHTWQQSLLRKPEPA